MMSLPFLVPVHRLPLPSFESEWLAVLLGLLAALGMLAAPGRALSLPPIALAPLALALVVLLQLFGDTLAYASNAGIFAAYLGWAAMLTVVGRNGADAIGAPRQLSMLAHFVLAGALASACLGFLQYTGLWDLVPGLVLAPASVAAGSGIYGNLAQQNHFATYIGLGLAAVAHLHANGQLVRRWSALFGLVLLAALLLSGSRSSFLYLGCIGAAWMLCTGASLRRAALLLAGGLVLLCAVAFAAHHALLGPQFARLLAFGNGAGPRLFLWQHAWTMFAEHPLFGVGIDRFADMQVGQLADGAKMWGVDQYAHNLVLQLLAVSGLAGLLALMLPSMLLLRRMAARARSREYLWAWSVLAILFVHSMLEQPLHYAYFLGIAAFVAGTVDRSVPMPRLPGYARVGAIVLLGASTVWMGKSARDYHTLAVEFYGEDSGDPFDQRHQELIVRLHGNVLLTPITELISPATFVAADAPVAEKLAFNTRLLRYAPVADVEYRQAALLAEQGQIDAAKAQLRRAARAYPADLPRYASRIEQIAASDPVLFGELARFVRELKTLH